MLTNMQNYTTAWYPSKISDDYGGKSNFNDGFNLGLL